MFSFVNKSIKKRYERYDSCSHIVIKAGFLNSNLSACMHIAHRQTSCFSNYTGKEYEHVCERQWPCALHSFISQAIIHLRWYVNIELVSQGDGCGTGAHIQSQSTT